MQIPMFFREAVLKNFAKFTGKYMCWILVFLKSSNCPQYFFTG